MAAVSGTLFDQLHPEGEELLPCDGSAVLHRGAIPAPLADRALAELALEAPDRAKLVRSPAGWVPEPRLTVWFGDPGCAYTYSGLTLEPTPWSPAALEVKAICDDVAGVVFNSCLLNLYRDGRDSVDWHADDEPELGRRPTIASVTLGAERRFVLRHSATRERVEVVPPHGSVLVMSGDSQHRWRHQVPKTAKPVGVRINLTYRVVRPV
jgi:alkylated DNA repair dioxygenase AlkB